MEILQTCFGNVVWFFQHLFNPELLRDMLVSWGWVAYFVLFGIVFSETGLLVGFFLPGDSLLFVAGFVCQIAVEGIPVLKFAYLAPLLCTAAFIGDNVGYWLGRRTGPMIFRREDSLLFHKKHLERTQKFYEKYGGRTIVYARFVPIVRTFAPFVAGVGRMEYRRFLGYSFCGSIGWILSMMSIGYFFGGIPIVQRNLEKAVVAVIFISLIPLLIEGLKARREKQAEKRAAEAAAAAVAMAQPPAES